jgi:hypothetical protein
MKLTTPIYVEVKNKWPYAFTSPMGPWCVQGQIYIYIYLGVSALLF